MTQLRDARLKRALESAPDATLPPPDPVRASVRDFAHRAVAQQPEPSAWSKWWKFTGSASPVWNTAFAGIAIAALVTVIWYDREVPGASGESPVADRPSPAAPAPAPAPAAGPAPAPAKAPAAPAAPVAEAPAAKPAVPRAAQAPVADAPRRPPAAMADARPARADALGETQRPAALAKAAPEAGEPSAQRATRAEAAGMASADMAVAAAPAATAAASPAFAPPAAPARTLAREMAARPSLAADQDTWTRAKITVQRNVAEVGRAEAERLPGLLASLARSRTSQMQLEGLPAMRVELRGPGTEADFIELFGSQVRWVRVRDGERQVQQLAPDAALMRSLAQELERLAAR